MRMVSGGFDRSLKFIPAIAFISLIDIITSDSLSKATRRLCISMA